MSDHKTTPGLVHVVGRPHTCNAQRRPTLPARIAARLRAGRYDRLLAVGVVPEPGSPLAAHRARLTSAAERRAIAASLRRAVREARHPVANSSRIPVNVPNLAAAEELIDQVALRLHSPQPIGVLGMARLRLVLSDGGGPLYRFGRGDLTGRLGAALAEL